MYFQSKCFVEIHKVPVTPSLNTISDVAELQSVAFLHLEFFLFYIIVFTKELAVFVSFFFAHLTP